jgi:hypothetical protein
LGAGGVVPEMEHLPSKNKQKNAKLKR